MVVPNPTKIRRFVPGILGLAILAFAWFKFREIPNQKQTLPDGTTMSLIQVNYGTNSILWKGTWFQKTFRRFIPSNGVDFAGIQIEPPDDSLQTESANSNLVLWIQSTGSFGHTFTVDAASTNGYQQLPSPGEPFRAIAFDEHGNEFEGELNMRNGEIGSCEFSAFPRNGKTVRVAIQREAVSNVWRNVAEFVVRNPTPGPHKSWDAETMPQVRRIGPTQFVLESLRIGRGIITGSGDKLIGKATFVVIENGRVTDAWEPESIVFSERNGNYCENSALFEGVSGTDSGTSYFRYMDRVLTPGEAWKLKVEFSRTSDFSARELCTVSNLPTPASLSGSFEVLTNYNGVAVRIYAYHGQLPKGRMATLPSYYPPDCVLVDLPEARQGRWVTIVSATDDRGRPLVLKNSRSGPNVSLGVPPSDAKTINLTFAITKSVYVEFIAKPTMVPRGDAVR